MAESTLAQIAFCLQYLLNGNFPKHPAAVPAIATIEDITLDVFPCKPSRTSEDPLNICAQKKSRAVLTGVRMGTKKG